MRSLGKLAVAALSAAGLAVLAPSAANADQAGAGTFQVKTTLTGMCASVGDNSSSAGMHLIQYRCDYKDNKRWTFGWAGTNAYTLAVRSTGMCMTPKAHSTADHAVITQDYCRSLDTQVWITEPSGVNTYRLRNRASGLCLTVAWGRTNSGQPLDQTTCGAYDRAQDWTLKSV